MNKYDRRVKFLPEHDTILEINNLDEYTKQEILNSWFTKKELAKIVKRSFKHALEWESGMSSKAESFHRGLEVYTLEGEEISRMSIERCVDAVMDEQDAQWNVGVDDYDRIAAASEEVTRFSVALALEQAVADEQEAKRIYQQMEKKNKKAKISKRPSSSVFKSEEDDDHTSICSDLSHPEPDSSHTRESSSDFEPAQKIPKTENPVKGTFLALNLPNLIYPTTSHK